jgi:uncharacterized protein YjbJ (UPF0337 family)
MKNFVAPAKWIEIKGKIKAKWDKFSDDEIENLKGNLDPIVGKIQRSYGYDKDIAEIEFSEFKASLRADSAEANALAAAKSSSGSDK